MVTDIQINTNNGQGSYTSGGAGGGKQATVNVTKDEPWDKLSKAFKKYTHTINYPMTFSRRDGSPSDYSIKVVGPSSTSGDNTFTYKNLQLWVHEVEVYFWADANPSSANPLVVGFISPNWRESDAYLGRHSSKGCKSSTGRTGRGSKCYYTWTYLTGNSNRVFNGEINDENAISEKDLIHGLLEELGNSSSTGLSNRPNKLVIRLDEQPTNNSLTYPESKYFTQGSGKSTRKVTVTKLGTGVDTGYVEGYDVYEHSVDSTGDSVSGTGDGDDWFYVTHGNDSKRVMTGLSAYVRPGSLKSVTVYYKTGTGDPKNPVLITFSFKDGSISRISIGDKLYGYSYGQFVRDLKNETQRVNPKTITSGDLIKGGPSGIKGKLQEEIERLVPLIEFRSSSGPSGPLSTTNGSRHENIKITELQPVTGDKGHTFKSVEMTPKTDDKAGGFDVGPWTVYNDYLLGYEKDAKIQDNDGVLTSIVTNDVTSSSSKKYSSITVYYAMTNESGNGDNWALLVKFVKANSRVDGRISSGGGETKYIKRTDQKGTTWEDDRSITGGHDDDEVLRVLQQQWKNFRPLIEFRKGNGGRGTTGRSHKNIRQESDQVGGHAGHGNNTFTKITYRPDMSKAKGGPWEVYNDYLLERGSVSGLGSVDKIHINLLKGITTDAGGESTANKYERISVYYAVIGGKNKALLVEFCAGDGTRKYIKRDSSGVKWTNADDISSRIAGDGGDATLAQVLTQIRDAVFGTVSRQEAGSSSSSVEGNGSVGGRGDEASTTSSSSNSGDSNPSGNGRDGSSSLRGPEGPVAQAGEQVGGERLLNHGSKDDSPVDSNGDGGGSSNSGTLHQIMEVIKKPEVYASASGVAGVGVMATVGGVVYKKCIVGGAVAAGKAAAKVAASAASGM